MSGNKRNPMTQIYNPAPENALRVFVLDKYPFLITISDKKGDIVIEIDAPMYTTELIVPFMEDETCRTSDKYPGNFVCNKSITSIAPNLHASEERNGLLENIAFHGIFSTLVEISFFEPGNELPLLEVEILEQEP